MDRKGKPLLDVSFKELIKEFPDGKKWLMLQHFVRRTTIRAGSIKKRKNRQKDYDGHHVDEAAALGNIKCLINTWEII